MDVPAGMVECGGCGRIQGIPPVEVRWYELGDGKAQWGGGNVITMNAAMAMNSGGCDDCHRLSTDA